MPLALICAYRYAFRCLFPANALQVTKLFSMTQQLRNN